MPHRISHISILFFCLLFIGSLLLACAPTPRKSSSSKKDAGTTTGDAGDTQEPENCDPPTPHPDTGEVCTPFEKLCVCQDLFLCQADGKIVTWLKTCGEGTLCNAVTAECDCVPQCDGTTCGDDGCGGTCACGEGVACLEGVCECTPACDGKLCGDNGCGGSCGECTDGVACGVDGTCSCTPSCAGKLCGDNGCGGSCGECPDGVACGADGKCSCAPTCDGKTCGDNGCGGSCGPCPGCGQADLPALCVDFSCQAPTCCPACDGKACGDDGCSGSCGNCGAGTACNSSGQCVEASGACVSSADQEIIASAPADSCDAGGYFSVLCKSFECWFFNCFSDTKKCVSTCVNDTQSLALSLGCRDCHGGFVDCINNASGCGTNALQCFLGLWGPTCDQCFAPSHPCVVEYESCSGLDVDNAIPAP